MLVAEQGDELAKIFSIILPDDNLHVAIQENKVEQGKEKTEYL